MPSAVIGALRVDLDLNTAAFQAGAARADAQAQSLSRRMQNIGAGMSRLGAGMSMAVTAPLAALVATSIPAATQARQALAQVEAANRSMGNASRLSTAALQAEAEALMNISNFDDDDILQKVTANLLTFGNVQGDVFRDAQLQVVNLAARLGTDLQGATLMVGKALNDPIRGLAAMRRVGIQFTQQQEQQIRTMVAANNTAGAQRIMLQELERQFGGAAAAQRAATPGQDARQAWAEFQETVGELALRVLPVLSAAATRVLNALNNLDPSTQRIVIGIGLLAAAVGPVMMVLGPLISGLGGLVGMFTSTAAAAGPTVGIMARLVPMLTTLGAVLLPIAAIATGIYLAWKNWNTIGPMLANLWGFAQRTIGPPLINLMNTVKQVATELWQGPLGRLIAQNAIPTLRLLGQVFGVVFGLIVRAIAGIVNAASGLVTAIGGAVRMITGILTGDWRMAWEGAKAMVGGIISGIVGFFEAMVPGITGAVSRVYNAIKTWLVDRFTSLASLVLSPIRAIEGGFAWLYDRVVGNSWVPDMVDGIAAHIGRLDQEMAEPARRAARKTADAIQEETRRATQAVATMRQELGGLLSRLFPEATRLRQWNAEIALLEQGVKRFGISADQAAEARRRMVTEIVGPEETPADIFARWQEESEARGTDPLTNLTRNAERDLESTADRLGRLIDDDLARLAEGAGARTARIAQSFAEMARDAVASVRGMAQAFRSGDILGAIEKMLDLVVQVTGAIRGIRGGSTATYNRSSNPVPAGSGRQPGFATGGSFTVGGAPGTDRNLVSFRATKGELVNISRPGQRPGGGNYYDLRGAVVYEDLMRKIEATGDAAAVRGSVGGARMAVQQLQRRGRRALA